MRTVIRILLFILLAGVSKAQSNHHTQVVLEIKNFSQQKHVQPINAALSAAFGTSSIVSYCEISGWVVLNLDLNHYRSTESLLEVLKPTGLEFYVKEGATASQVSQACKGEIKQF